jgi:glycosyltransferase involved in cell wall biosynthesis
MKISLIYHVYRNANTLEESLNSIVNQDDKNFELILINDGGVEKVNNILKQYNFSSICKSFKYMLYSQNQGHAISFNETLKHCDSDYVYYLGSNIVLKSNFVKTINNIIESKPNADVISFTHVVKKSKSVVNEFNSLDSDLQYKVTPSLRDKVFSLSFLKQKNI